jgi:hypothetical protein
MRRENIIRKLKVRCAYCGKDGKVLILFSLILSRKWLFFGKFEMGEDVFDYWECRECAKTD